MYDACIFGGVGVMGMIRMGVMGVGGIVMADFYL